MEDPHGKTHQSGSISVRIRILQESLRSNFEMVPERLHVLCLFGLFHLMENDPTRPGLPSKEDRVRVDV